MCLQLNGDCYAFSCADLYGCRRRIFNYASSPIMISCLASVRKDKCDCNVSHSAALYRERHRQFMYSSLLTPKALKRFRRGWRSCLFKNTSDLGRGGFFGRIITRVSSLMSSSSNLLSDETDNWRWTRSWSLTPDQSESGKRIFQFFFLFRTLNRERWFLLYNRNCFASIIN